MNTEAIKEYTQSIIFNQLFDDVLYIVESATDYLENESLYDNALLDSKEQKNFGNQCLELTNRLSVISKAILQYKALAKGEINSLQDIDLTPFEIKHNPNLSFKWNLLLTNSKHLHDRLQRIDNQFKTNKVSYFDNLNIKL